MAIQAFVSIAFTTDTPQEAEAIVNGITGLPSGATVNTSLSQTLTDASGTVDDGGNIAPPEQPPVVMPHNGGT